MHRSQASESGVDMPSDIKLIGFRHSVYTWVVRFALARIGQRADYIETNPFADPPDPVLATYTPLGRVPVLEHDGLRLTETQAILRYLDAVFDAGLLATAPQAQGQMAQVMGLVDADVYPILVRQVFSHGCYAPDVMNEPGQAEVVAAGLKASGAVLSVLEQVAEEGRVLNRKALTLADLHLGPMMSYFVRVQEGRELLRNHPSLNAWWEWMAAHDSLRDTDPLPQIAHAP